MDKTNDSTLFFVNHTGPEFGRVFREGNEAAWNYQLGYLFSRVAVSRAGAASAFGAPMIPMRGGAAKQAVFSPVVTIPTMTVSALQDQDAPGTGAIPAKYRSFFGGKHFQQRLRDLVGEPQGSEKRCQDE